MTGMPKSDAACSARARLGSAMATTLHRASRRYPGRCACLAHAPAPRTATRIWRDVKESGKEIGGKGFALRGELYGTVLFVTSGTAPPPFITKAHLKPKPFSHCILPI